MEALYSKLYDKYNDIKTKRMTEMDQLNKDQEVKFVKYVSAAEELIQYFKSDKEKLMSQVNELRSELASARISKECSEYQKLWIEEGKKNRALSEEIERLQKLQHDSSISIRKGSKKRQENTPQVISGTLFDSSTVVHRRSKRGKLSETEVGGTTQHDSPQVDEVRQESANGLHKQTVSRDTGVSVRKSECCTTIGGSGDDSTNCIYQTLFENLLGMKFSVLTQNGVRVSAEHPSSGYSFSLTWLEKEDGKEVELQYDVVSLGTFERVAPDWMKEAIKFSTTMCPIFFDRVSRVVKLYS